MNTKESLIFYTGQQPIQEMLSSVDPATLGAGQFALLDNLSISKNRVSARWGCHRLGNVPVASAAYRGGWSGYIHGLWTKIAAFRVSGKTRIYLLDGSYAWQEISDSSNRLDTDGFVEFAPVTDSGLTIAGVVQLAKQDGIICGNGEDEPGLIYYDTQYRFARIAKPGVVDDKPILVQEIYPSGWFDIRDGTGITFTSSANLIGASTAPASATDNEVRVTFNAAAAVNDTLEVVAPTSFMVGPMGLDQCRMFHLLVEDVINDPVFNYLDIAVYSNATSSYTTVFNSVGTGGSYTSLPLYTANSPNVYLASFDLSTNTSVSSLTHLARFKLTVRRKIPANRQFRILAFMSGGNIDAGSEIVGSFGLKSTRVETPAYGAQVLRNPLLSNVGGTALRAINVIQPTGTYWMNWVRFGVSASSTTNDMGIIYRRDPDVGDIDFYGSDGSYFINGSWNIANNRADQKDYSRKAPSAFNVRPPKAAVFAAGSNRLYAGRISDDKSRVMISDENFPMRFSSIPRDSDADGFTDPDSGTAVAFPGEEVQRMINLPGSMVGVSPVAIITNRNIWRLEGIDSLSLSRPTLLSPHGTLYPRTVALQKGNLYFLDSERQPRVLTGGYDAQPLGIWKIEDQLQSGDPANAVAVVYREAYKLAYRAPAASVNQRVLNYEERLNGWHRHTYLDPNWAGFILDEVSPALGTRLLGIAETGEVFEVEQVGKEWDERKAFGQMDSITITLKTGEMHGDLWQSLFFGRVGVLCDKVESGILYVTRNDPAWSANDGTPVGHIRCGENVEERAWRYDQDPFFPKRPCGIKAQSCELTITGDWTPGKNIKGLYIEIGQATKKPDVAQ